METLTFEQLPTAVSLLSRKLENIERLLLDKNSQLPTEQKDELLTVNQAAEFLNLTVPTIYSKACRGEIPLMKRSKRIYFSRNELLDYLRAGRKKTTAEIEAEAESYIRRG
jgi:excisionase family DNA binding protein